MHLQAQQRCTCGWVGQSLARHRVQSHDPVCQVLVTRNAPHSVNTDTRDMMMQQLRLDVADDLADLRYEHFLPERAIRLCKLSAQRWADMIANTLLERLAPALRAEVPVDFLEAELNGCTRLFTGLETPRQELKQLTARVPYVKPIKRVLGVSRQGSVATQDVCWDVPIIEAYVLRLQKDATFRRHHVEWNKIFKSGELYRVKSEILTHPLTADAARFHEKLFKKATEAEANDFRGALSWYNDAFDVRACPSLALHAQRSSHAFIFCICRALCAVLMRATVE